MNDNCKILIIDDEQIVLDSCSEILAGSSYQVATASDGKQGLDLLEKFQPDLVFVDLKMPGLSGLEVLEAIQAFDPTVVTIVITGYATVSSAVEAMKFGAYDFLPKPFTPAEYRMITKRGLEKRGLVLETIALRREKEMLRENFAAIVSHELKAPLGAIQQNLYVLIPELSGQLSDSQQRRLERMKVRIGDLVELIRTWLRVISVDIETIKDRFQPVSLSSVILKAVESVQHHAARKDIEITTSIEEPRNPVWGDQGTLTEVLVNLCNNAIKYSYPRSAVEIASKEKDGHVLISVTDTGIGISDEDLPFVFDDFYRGKQGQKDDRGSGLGLALSRRIIETHNGSISVTTEVGKGSTFVVDLPISNHDHHSQPRFSNNDVTSPS